ncbi:Uncharacterized protein TCM_041716 [Theobroma cacao]|uniref:Uncharacterized protein n=1 Tax=Theobroma cacao TaxID=3641 RepID=A0A061GVJ2_THECC|nr:Uncharacterized protein TCM_041716 [Theobroma cacao]
MPMAGPHGPKLGTTIHIDLDHHTVPSVSPGISVLPISDDLFDVDNSPTDFIAVMSHPNISCKALIQDVINERLQEKEKRSMI